MKQTNYEIIKDLDKQNIIECLNVAEFIDEEEINNLNDIDDIIDYLDEIITGHGILNDESEVISCSDALNILAKYDPKVERALNNAEDYGYSIKNFDGETVMTVATLLMYERALKQFNEYKDNLIKEWND